MQGKTGRTVKKRGKCELGGEEQEEEPRRRK